MKTFLAIAASVLVASIFAPAASAAGGAKPGGFYEGPTAGGGTSFRVSKDGSKLSDFSTEVRARCTNGKRIRLGVYAPGEKKPSIGADGSVSFRAKPGPLRLSFGRGRALTTFDGRFSGDGSTFSGTIDSTWKGRRVSCSAKSVPFTATTATSPRAAFRGRRLATGVYRGRGKDVSGFKALVFGASGQLRSASFQTRMRCANGGRFGVRTKLRRLRIAPNGSMVLVSTERYRVRGLGVVRERGRVAIKFFKQGPAFRLQGKVTGRAVATRGGRRVTTCRANGRLKGYLSQPGA